ncbi:transposase [Rubinisphaera sp. ICM_H10]|nr:transposase [Rubinisphaera margarita]MCG6158347.1 transposase [Rubinisphaera margarita]
MLLTEANGLPVGVQLHSASPAEVKLIRPLLRCCRRKTSRSKRLVYDKAADSAQLREQIRWHGLRLIAPYRRRRNETRARRLLARDQAYYKLRYQVERCFAWMTHFRRLNVRWEYHWHLFEGFWQLACMFTILKRL